MVFLAPGGTELLLGYAGFRAGALCHRFCLHSGLQRVEQMTGCVTAGVSCRAGKCVCHLIARLRDSLGSAAKQGRGEVDDADRLHARIEG